MLNDQSIILGLDISTSCTGFSVLRYDGTVIDIGHLDLSKCDDLWSKVDIINSWILTLPNCYCISHIFVEEALKSFRPGFSSASTLSLLSRFNGIVCCLVRQALRVDPELIGATTARTTCGIKVKKGKANGPGKEQVFRHVTSLMLIRDWPTGRTGKVKDFCYDEVDSYVIAEAGRRILNSRGK